MADYGGVRRGLDSVGAPEPAGAIYACRMRRSNVRSRIAASRRSPVASFPARLAAVARHGARAFGKPSAIRVIWSGTHQAGRDLGSFSTRHACALSGGVLATCVGATVQSGPRSRRPGVGEVCRARRSVRTTIEVDPLLRDRSETERDHGWKAATQWGDLARLMTKADSDWDRGRSGRPDRRPD